MKETKSELTQTEDFNSLNKEKEKSKFLAKCFNCKDKEKVTTDNGMSFDLPYKLVEIPKNTKLIKESKELVKESETKYGKPNVIKRVLINQCPECGGNITLNCSEYVDFYKSKTKK